MINMRYFIHHFLENSIDDSLNSFPSVEYSKELNLSVFKDSRLPAISTPLLGTITMTKAGDEPSDSDYDNSILTKASLGTITQTRNMLESSDSDYGKTLFSAMGTSTVTLVSLEGTDSDHERRSFV